MRGLARHALWAQRLLAPRFNVGIMSLNESTSPVGATETNPGPRRASNKIEPHRDIRPGISHTIDHCGETSANMKTLKSTVGSLLILTMYSLIASGSSTAAAQTSTFGPQNPFYAASTLPFEAPPFDKIKDSDYQPAIDAGMAEQLKEVEAIANNSAPPTFENTLVALEKSGQLLNRVMNVFGGVTAANTNETLQKVLEYEAPRQAALRDAIYLNANLFARVKAIYDQRESLHLDAESLKLVDYTYNMFIHSGANLSDADKEKLKKNNAEDSTLQASFINKLLASTKAGAYFTSDASALAGYSDSQLAAAAREADGRGEKGWLIPLQNTTQQPDLEYLTNRTTRQALFEDSWNRAERGDANDTRQLIARLAELRAQKAGLLGFPSYAAWTLTDQMAKRLKPRCTLSRRWRRRQQPGPRRRRTTFRR
jgi:peptidyl-dipeptidase Dcp